MRPCSTITDCGPRAATPPGAAGTTPGPSAEPATSCSRIDGRSLNDGAEAVGCRLSDGAAAGFVLQAVLAPISTAAESATPRFKPLDRAHVVTGSSWRPVENAAFFANTVTAVVASNSCSFVMPSRLRVSARWPTE